MIIMAAAISLIVNDVPTYVNPWERLILLILILLLVSPFVYSNALMEFRIRTFNNLNWLITAFVLLSLIGSVINLSFVNGKSGFSGFFNHSMLLGPLAGISLIISIYKYHCYHKLNWKVLFLLTSLSSFLTCLLAGSRSALIACLISVMFFYYKKGQGKFTRFLKNIFILAFIMTMSFPLWENNLGAIKNKIEYAESKGDFTASRKNLWDLRIQEIKSSPLFGIGLGNGTIPARLSNTEKEKLEPGSSWLALFSMLGLFGLIPFLFFAISFFRQKQVEGDILFNSMLLALILFFLIHMITEGYILSIGSFLFFYFWLLTGVKKNSSLKYAV